MDRTKAETDLVALYKKLLKEHYTYFSHDILNSEGRKVLRQFSRAFLEVYPQHKPMLTRIRREPTLKNVMKLAKVLKADCRIIF